MSGYSDGSTFNVNDVYELGNSWFSCGDQLTSLMTAWNNAMDTVSWVGAGGDANGNATFQMIVTLAQLRGACYDIGGEINYYGQQADAMEKKIAKEMITQDLSYLIGGILLGVLVGLIEWLGPLLLGFLNSLLENLVNIVSSIGRLVLQQLPKVLEIGSFADPETLSDITPTLVKIGNFVWNRGVFPAAVSLGVGVVQSGLTNVLSHALTGEKVTWAGTDPLSLGEDAGLGVLDPEIIGSGLLKGGKDPFGPLGLGFSDSAAPKAALGPLPDIPTPMIGSGLDKLDIPAPLGNSFDVKVPDVDLPGGISPVAHLDENGLPLANFGATAHGPGDVVTVPQGGDVVVHHDGGGFPVGAGGGDRGAGGAGGGGLAEPPPVVRSSGGGDPLGAPRSGWRQDDGSLLLPSGRSSNATTHDDPLNVGIDHEQMAAALYGHRDVPPADAVRNPDPGLQRSSEPVAGTQDADALAGGGHLSSGDVAAHADVVDVRAPHPGDQDPLGPRDPVAQASEGSTAQGSVDATPAAHDPAPEGLNGPAPSRSSESVPAGARNEMGSAQAGTHEQATHDYVDPGLQRSSEPVANTPEVDALAGGGHLSSGDVAAHADIVGVRASHPGDQDSLSPKDPVAQAPERSTAQDPAVESLNGPAPSRSSGPVGTDARDEIGSAQAGTPHEQAALDTANPVVRRSSDPVAGNQGPDALVGGGRLSSGDGVAAHADLVDVRASRLGDQDPLGSKDPVDQAARLESLKAPTDDPAKSDPVAGNQGPDALVGGGRLSSGDGVAAHADLVDVRASRLGDQDPLGSKDPVDQAARLESLKAPTDDPAKSDPLSRAPEAPTEAPVPPARYVAQRVQDLVRIARDANMPREDRAMHATRVQKAADAKDWASAGRLLAGFRDHVDVSVLNHRLAAFEDHVRGDDNGDGFGRLAGLDVDRKVWQNKVDAVRGARRTGDMDLQNAALHDFTAYVERHVPSEVLTGKDAPRPFDADLTRALGDLKTAYTRGAHERVSDEISNLVKFNALRDRLDALTGDRGGEENALRLRIASSGSERDAGAALRDLHEFRELQDFEDRLSRLKSDAGSVSPSIEEHLDALRGGADSREIELKRLVDEAANGDDALRALGDLHEYREARPFEERLNALKSDSAGTDHPEERNGGRDDVDEEVLRRRVEALGEDESDPRVTHLRHQARAAVTQKDATHALDRLRWHQDRLEKARRVRVVKLSTRIDKLRENLSEQLMDGRFERADQVRGRLDDLQGQLDHTLSHSEKQAKLFAELYEAVDRPEAEGHLDRIVDKGLSVIDKLDAARNGDGIHPADEAEKLLGSLPSVSGFPEPHTRRADAGSGDAPGDAGAGTAHTQGSGGASPEPDREFGPQSDSASHTEVPGNPEPVLGVPRGHVETEGQLLHGGPDPAEQAKGDPHGDSVVQGSREPVASPRDAAPHTGEAHLSAGNEGGDSGLVDVRPLHPADQDRFGAKDLVTQLSGKPAAREQAHAMPTAENPAGPHPLSEAARAAVWAERKDEITEQYRVEYEIRAKIESSRPNFTAVFSEALGASSYASRLTAEELPQVQKFQAEADRIYDEVWEPAVIWHADVDSPRSWGIYAARWSRRFEELEERFAREIRTAARLKDTTILAGQDAQAARDRWSREGKTDDAVVSAVVSVFEARAAELTSSLSGFEEADYEHRFEQAYAKLVAGLDESFESTKHRVERINVADREFDEALEQWKDEHPGSFVETFTSGIFTSLAEADPVNIHTRLVLTTHLHQLRNDFVGTAAGPEAENVSSLKQRFDLLDTFVEGTLQLTAEVRGVLAEYGDEAESRVAEELRAAHAEADSSYRRVKDGLGSSRRAPGLLRQQIGEVTNGLGNRLRFDDQMRGVIGEVEAAGREVVQTYVEASGIPFEQDSLERVARGVRTRAEEALKAVRDGLRADHYEPASADRAFSRLGTEFNQLLEELPDRLEEEDELTALVGEAGSRFAGLLRPEEPNAERIAASLGGRLKEDWVRDYREIFDRPRLDVSAWLAAEREGADRFHRRVVVDGAVAKVPEFEMHELLGEGWIEQNLKSSTKLLGSPELARAAEQLAEVLELRLDGVSGRTGVIRLKLDPELRANRPATTIAIVQRTVQRLNSTQGPGMRILLDTGFGDPIDMCA